MPFLVVTENGRSGSNRPRERPIADLAMQLVPAAKADRWPAWAHLPDQFGREVLTSGFWSLNSECPRAVLRLLLLVVIGKVRDESVHQMDERQPVAPRERSRDVSHVLLRQLVVA